MFLKCSAYSKGIITTVFWHR